MNNEGPTGHFRNGMGDQRLPNLFTAIVCAGLGRSVEVLNICLADVSYEQ